MISVSVSKMNLIKVQNQTSNSTQNTTEKSNEQNKIEDFNQDNLDE